MSTTSKDTATVQNATQETFIIKRSDNFEIVNDYNDEISAARESDKISNASKHSDSKHSDSEKQYSPIPNYDRKMKIEHYQRVLENKRI